MPVNENLQALGAWSVTLRQDTPRSVLDRVRFFGHVAVHSARQLHPETIGDALLGSARYVGVVRARQFTGSQGGGGLGGGDGINLGGAGGTVPETNLVGGSGMAYWLGDEDGKGAVIEAPGIGLQGALFTEGVRALLPASGAVVEGTLHPMVGSPFTGGYVYVSPRKAITDFCGYWSDDDGEAEWRVNGDGTLDAGPVSTLYSTTPRAVIARKAAGQDLTLRGLAGTAEHSSDVADYSTRVVVLAEGEGDAVATGQADINPALNPYIDLHGNPVRLTRLVSQSGLESGNADASATVQLNRFLRPRRSTVLSSSDVDVRGTFGVGDWVWAYDPDSGLMDLTNEVYFRGQRIYPVSIRATELSWPITDGMGVAYRDQDGTWLDLTDYVVWEDPEAVEVTVGGASRSLLDAGSEPVGSRPKPDSSIPGQVEILDPIGLSSYQSSQGVTRAQAAIRWARPANTDGTAIIDGSHYELRWRTSAHQILPVTWAYLAQAGLRWVDLVQWDGMLPAVEGPWQYTAVGFDISQFLLSDLTPGMPYDIQVRAVDMATPPNYGDWSETETFQTPYDPFPPHEPAPPLVASSLIAVQVTHLLGRSDGGTFNLDADLHHLEVHAAYEPTFTPNESSLLGRMLANAGTLLSGAPLVGTFQLALTTDVWVKVVAVDQAGNRSGASGGAQSSALLIDDEHISSLTVSKVTAGEITANWLVGADIATAFTGTRAGLNAFGFYAYDQSNQQTFMVDAETGDVYLVGVVDTASNGSRVRIAPSEATHILEAPGIYMWAPDSDNPALIFGTAEGTDPEGSAIAVSSSLDATNNRVGVMHVRDNRAYLGLRGYMPPDAANPHGSYLENGSYFAAVPSRAEMAMVGQVVGEDIDYDGGFVTVARDSARVGFETATVPQVFMAWDSAGALQCKGRFFALATSNTLGLFVGNVTPAGAGGFTLSYGATQVDPHGIVATPTGGSYVVALAGSTQVQVVYGSAASTAQCSIWVFGLDH